MGRTFPFRGERGKVRNRRTGAIPQVAEQGRLPILTPLLTAEKMGPI